mmetsp:Transcript_19297/g.53804  ORF Transcript_19297/g.53804 Transcript_19297/m.53804 type:complete len:90 (+) Transcript_19297:1326-1595(+)
MRDPVPCGGKRGGRAVALHVANLTTSPPVFVKVDLVSVVGEPLELPTIASPTKEEVNIWHERYMAALHDLFERNKAKYSADPNAQLVMN